MSRMSKPSSMSMPPRPTSARPTGRCRGRTRYSSNGQKPSCSTSCPSPGRRPGTFDLYLKEDIFVEHFGDDLPADTARRLWATQRVASTAAFETPATAGRLEDDPVLVLHQQRRPDHHSDFRERAMAERARSTVTTFDGGSHLTLISHPEAVTAVIQSAIDSVNAKDEASVGWDARRRAKTQRLTAGAAYADGKVADPQQSERPAAQGDPAGRSRRTGGRQPEAGRLPVPHAGRLRPGKAARPAHADLVGVAARASRPVRDAASPPRSTSPTPARRASGSPQMVEDGSVANRRHPHLRRAVRADVHRPGTRRRAAVRVAGRPRRQSLHRTQHRGHADDRRGRRVSRRRRHRSGRRDRRQRRKTYPAWTSPATGSTSSSRPTGPSRWSRCSPATRARSATVEILKAMIAIRGVYERHRGRIAEPRRSASTPRPSNCCCPPTASSSGSRAVIARHWALNPHPTLIPAIESGWVASIHSFGGEAGMERYTAARPDVFFTGVDGSLRSNRVLASWRASTPSTCSSDRPCRSTATPTPRPSPTDGCPGFGGAPNMGHDPHGRRHASSAWLEIGARFAARRGAGANSSCRSPRPSAPPACRPSSRPLDAIEVGKKAGMPMPPVMIYGDDVSHVVTEEGVAYLYKAHVAGRPTRGALGDRRGHTGRTRRRRSAHGGNSAATGWSPFPKTSASRPDWPPGRCWPPAASMIWSLGRAASTTRPHSSGTGEPMTPLRMQPNCTARRP